MEVRWAFQNVETYKTKEEMQDKVRDNSYHCNLLQQPTE
jgi:hypothetical protein